VLLLLLLLLLALGFGLIPEPVDDAGELDQLGAPEPADRLIPSRLQPLHGPLDGGRAAVQLVDDFRQRLAQRLVRANELPAGQRLNDDVGINADEVL
jgi:hypothetical protein